MERKKITLIHNTYPVILGIDPGYGRLGIAIVGKTKEGEELIHSECFETDSKLSHHKRLFLISEKIKKIIEKYKPERLAIETLLWSKNKKTALQVAESRGVILVEASRKNLVIHECNPNQIKLAITGYGKSDKKQVISMVEKLIKIKPNSPSKGNKIRHDDEYDAIAIALTSLATPLSTEFV